MTTVQIVGIAVAAAVVMLLVVALVVTRRRGGKHEPPDDVSFLDLSPQDTLDGLGRAEEPVEDVTLEPQAVRALRSDPAAAESPSRPAGPDSDPEDITGEIAPAVVLRPSAPAWAGDDLRGTSGLSWWPSDDERAVGPAGAADGLAAVGPPRSAAPAPALPDRKVPLADIIVTTSRKVVDLDDPEVRRMLKDLVKFEIDQATRYREQGQRTDAALQLAEAEKISRALGMNESADAIRQMMADLRG